MGCDVMRDSEREGVCLGGVGLVVWGWWEGGMEGWRDGWMKGGWRGREGWVMGGGDGETD